MLPATGNDPRETLSLPRDGGNTGNPPAPTRSIGWDQQVWTSIRKEDVAAAVGNTVIWPAIDLYSVARNIDRAQVRRFALQAEPEGFFLASCYWQLHVETGPVQEHDPQTRYVPPPASGFILNGLGPNHAAGFRGGYGVIAEPTELEIELPQSSTLRLRIFSPVVAGGFNLVNVVNIFCRSIGVVYFSR